MWSALLFSLLIPEVRTLICPADTGPVFLVAEQHSDRHNHCFDYCGRANCSAVLINPSGCVVLTRDDIPPPDSRTTAVHKHCVQNVLSTQIVYRESSRLLIDHTEKIEHAQNGFHCLSLCAQQTKFTCRSLMFYHERGECLLNSANSDTAEMSKDTEGYEVTYMERRLPGDVPCTSSFAALPPLGARIRGEFRKGNAESWERCLASCNGCDRVIFGKECLLLEESQDGRIMDVSTQIVFDNVCKDTPPLSCSPEESLYVSRTPLEGKDCLNRCLHSPDCQFAYRDGDSCLISPVPLSGKEPLIERICPGLGPLESGVLFEQKSKCPTGRGQRFKGMNLYQCMGLCLSHPASSCDSVAYHPEEELCELLDVHSHSGGNSSAVEDCLYFVLGIIEGPTLKEKTRLSGKTGKQRPSISPSVEVAPQKILKEDREKLNLKKRNDGELDVETACSYSHLNVKVKGSNKNFKAHLFLRNAFESCGKEFKDGTATIALPLNSSEACAADKHGNVYKAVVVIKEKTGDNMPVITAKDRMYTVSCDYSNQHAKINISRQLQIRDLPYNDMDIGGKKKTPNLVEMELRSKREEEKEDADEANSPPNYPISIGHPLELAIKQSSKQYAITSCMAENHDGKENVTLIEDGCPTLAAKDYIIRGSIQRVKKGFILPLRAFKFRNGNVVRISCVLQQCENCEKPVCGQRNRRNLPSSSEIPKEEVQAELLIQEQEEPISKGNVCLWKLQLIFGAVAWGGIIMVEASVLLFLGFKAKTLLTIFSH